MSHELDLRISQLELDIYQWLSEIGFDATISMRLRFRVNRITLNNALQTLWKMGLINRDIKGLSICNAYMEESPIVKEECLKQFGITPLP